MELIKKYWWVILVIMSLPIMLNFILIIPAFTKVVGNDAEWLSFWSGYLGAIISSIAAFVILYVQRRDNELQNTQNRVENQKENENNRHLQLNILRYQQEMNWLNAFRQISTEYVMAYTYNDLVHIANEMIMDKKPEKAFYSIKPLLERLAKCDIRLKYIGKHDKNSIKLYSECDDLFTLYNEVLDDVQSVYAYMIDNPQSTFADFYKASIEMPISDVVKFIIKGVLDVNNLTDIQKYNNVVMIRIKIIEERAEKIGNIFIQYIAKEQKRIDNILIENLN